MVWSVVQGLVAVAAGLLVTVVAWRHWFRRLERLDAWDLPFWASDPSEKSGTTPPSGVVDEDEGDFRRKVALLVDLAVHGFLEVRREDPAEPGGPVVWRLWGAPGLDPWRPVHGRMSRLLGWGRDARFTGTTRELVADMHRRAWSRRPRPGWSDIGAAGTRPGVPLLLVPSVYVALWSASMVWGRSTNAAEVWTFVVGTAVLAVGLIVGELVARHREEGTWRGILAERQVMPRAPIGRWTGEPETGLAYLVWRLRIHDPRYRGSFEKRLRSRLGDGAERYTFLLDMAGELTAEHTELLTAGRRAREEAERGRRQERQRLEREAARTRRHFGGSYGGSGGDLGGGDFGGGGFGGDSGGGGGGGI